MSMLLEIVLELMILEVIFRYDIVLNIVVKLAILKTFFLYESDV